jgi:ribosomal protein S10
MADFAMRAAYYLNLPAKGPTPLPKIIQRFTVPKSPFVHKKCQENFERITLRRLIQIQDGHTEVVKIWLAYLRRYAFWGVGMKANVWEYEGLGTLFLFSQPGAYLVTIVLHTDVSNFDIDVAQNMDKAYSDIEKDLEEKLSSFGYKTNVAQHKSLPRLLRSQDNRLPGMPMMERRPGIKGQKRPEKTESIY